MRCSSSWRPAAEGTSGSPAERARAARERSVAGWRSRRSRGAAVVARRMPRWSEFAQLVRPRAGGGGPTERRLARALTIGDLREIARRRAPRAVFDYTDGAAGAEISLRRSRAAFAGVEFQPEGAARRLRGRHPTATSSAGRPRCRSRSRPPGFTRMMHTRGRARPSRGWRHAAGIPYALSTMGTTSIEAARGRGARTRRRWFQLYLWRDRGGQPDLVAAGRAPPATRRSCSPWTRPVAGPRLRDVRNGLHDPARAVAAHGRSTAPLHPRGGSTC